MQIKQIVNVAFKPPPISYDLVIGKNLLEEAALYTQTIATRSFVIISKEIDRLIPHFGKHKLILPDGESIKSRAMKEKIEDALIERGFGKETCLIAIGGGALLDLVGFVAATYCRGMPFVSIPTTLLAMTDACLGGKTGVNVDEAKNWIGAFHHPKKIFVDLDFLKTLPQREFVFGLAEAVKHSLIADASLFSQLEMNLDRILTRDEGLLQKIILESCLIKKRIVEKDPYEITGFRRVLNFGHTIGHALETLSNYTRSHGQAVLMGMVVEAAIARRLGFLSHTAFERISIFLHKLLPTWDFPNHLPYEMLKRDKKGAYRFVILTGIGMPAHFDGDYATSVTEEVVQASLADISRETVLFS